MQTDVHKTAYLVYTPKKIPHVAAPSQKSASWAEIARYIKITYTTGYGQIFKSG